MRLPDREHTSRPWRIHEVAPDFRLEDVWELPGVGGPDAFPRLVRLVADMDPSSGHSFVARTLFAVRWKLGELFGWDEPASGVGAEAASLRDRLPADLRDAAPGPEFSVLPFTTLYLTDDEWAAEAANHTTHGVMHFSRIPDGEGTFRAHLAVLVKPSGVLGDLYMAAIKPFRYLFVYPALMRELGERWRTGERNHAPS